MSETLSLFSQRLHELRRRKAWSQPEVGKMIGTSGAIIGRYERGEMMPSIEVAKKLAEAFGVTLDYLVAEADRLNVLQDEAMLKRWQALDTLTPEDRERIVSVVDSLLRDARARDAYRGATASR